MAANSMNNSNQNIGNGIITDANNNMLNFPGMNSNLANLAALGEYQKQQVVFPAEFNF